MSDTGGSFQVDPSALGQLPAYLDEARTSLAAVHVDVGPAASGTGSSVGAHSIADLGEATAAFVSAGVGALGSDVAKLNEVAARYRRTEDGLSSSFRRSGGRR